MSSHPALPPAEASDTGSSPPPGKPGLLQGLAQGLGRFAGRLDWRLNLLLFLATLGTTTLAGAIMFGGESLSAEGHPGSLLGVLSSGLAYALPVMLILGSHEMGHYLFCRYYGVAATLPYFIPGPPFFGTFGAVIRMRPPIRGRKALFDIGIAGPLAGFLVAVPFLVYGVASAGAEPPPSAGGTYISFGDPLLLKILVAAIREPLPGGTDLVLNPALFAGWFGLLITAMNLFPVGQLDGGHVVYALSERLHRGVSRVTVAGMIALVAGSILSEWIPPISAGAALSAALRSLGVAAAVLTYMLWHRLHPPLARAAFALIVLLVLGSFVAGVFTPWLLWTVVLAFLRRIGHPPILDAPDPVGPARTALALAALLIFVFSFIPVPIAPISLAP